MITVKQEERVWREEWNCKEMKEHYDIVSWCCGAGEHEHVESMCGSCNEFTGWFCSVCEEDVDIL